MNLPRANLSRTRSALYAPTREPVVEIPAKAWTEVRYSSDTPFRAESVADDA